MNKELQTTTFLTLGKAENFGQEISEYKPTCKVLIVYDDKLPEQFVGDLISSLLRYGFITVSKKIAGGEFNKKLSTCEFIWNSLIEGGFTRSDLVVAVGGGTVSDVVGFCASTFMRGIDYAVVPTTLLSMVDASIGGKTGIDYSGLKNYVGTFHKPILTFTDVEILESLPARQIKSGYGEVIKTAILAGGELYEKVKSHDSLENVIPLCQEYKKRITDEDALESDLRRVLNFGHTYGHAIEELTGYTLSHGESVSVGMEFALKLSVKCGILDISMCNEILDVIKSYSLDTTVNVDINELLPYIVKDKKNKDGKIIFVLISDIGKPCIKEISKEDLIWN